MFAITKSGDLKVARFAQVYLFYLTPNLKEGDAVTPTEWEQGDTAAMAWTHEALKAAEDIGKWQDALFEEEKKNRYPSSDKQVEAKLCSHDLLLYGQAVIATLKWSVDQHKPGQILSTNTDEEGNFKIEFLYPGTYGLVARGRAGFNEAFWEMDKVLVEQGMETVVKVAMVKVACLKDN